MTSTALDVYRTECRCQTFLSRSGWKMVEFISFLIIYVIISMLCFSESLNHSIRCGYKTVTANSNKITSTKQHHKIERDAAKLIFVFIYFLLLLFSFLFQLVLVECFFLSDIMRGSSSLSYFCKKIWIIKLGISYVYDLKYISYTYNVPYMCCV